MRKEIHPQYYEHAKVRCACGNQFIVGATIPEIKVEICSNCHPFYTGKGRVVDTKGRVERFKKRLEKTKKKKKE
ncbi:MAG: 50S ribosomal protein L31 [Patescibacteria group bacterium]